MIRYFPNIYPDELFYSAYSRYYKHTGKGSVRATFLELFGTDNIVSAIHFPSHIDSFINQFKNIDYYTAEDIIFNFTLLPIFYPFLDKERQVYSISNMRGSNGKGLFMKLGVMASNLKSIQALKYCPECITEDVKLYGEPYFHRSHNIESVYVCHKHNRTLRTHCPICNIPINPKEKFKLIPLEDKCINGHDLYSPNLKFGNFINSHTDLQYHMSVAKIVNYILNLGVNRLNITIKDIYERYLFKLSKFDLLTPKGSIRQIELKEQFVNFYGIYFLKSLNLDFHVNEKYSWIEEMLHKKFKASHPIKHILFMIFLCKNKEHEIKQLLSAENDFSINPFGTSPWPCLNSVAEHYLKDVITDCTITTCSDTRKPVGTFKCSCGFIYSRRGPDANKSDRYKLGRIKAYGSVWENKLKATILTDGGSLRSIADKMKADPVTIKRHAKKLGIAYSWESKSNSDKKVSTNTCKAKANLDKSAEYSECIRNYILSLTEKPTISEIRRLYQKEYIYLYRNNKALLESISKECKIHSNTNYNSKVNWEERDSKFYSLLSKTINSILSSEKTCRITKSKLGKALGISSLLEQHSDKLPKTKSLIEKSIESIESYQIRRVRTIIEKMIDDDEKLIEWKIYRKAGLRNNCSNKVKEEITSLMNKSVISNNEVI